MKKLCLHDIKEEVSILKDTQNALYNSDGTLNSWDDLLEAEKIEEKLKKLYKQLDYIRKRDKNV